MKISTRSRYGLRFMVYLGAKYAHGSIHLNEVAENEKISEKYLEQIVPYLRSAGLVDSQRGNTGGYRLSKSPDKISLKDIIEPLEGNVILVDCSKRKACGCELKDICATRDMWSSLADTIANHLDNTKLSSLVGIFKEKRNGKSNCDLMYYI